MGRPRLCIRTFRPRLEAPPGAPRGPRGGPAVPAEDLAELGDVGPGAGRQRPGGWAGPGPADPRPAHRRPGEPPDRHDGGPGHLRRARRRHDHLHGDRVLGGLRGRPDPDVVVLAQARRTAAPRSGGHRGAGAADGHRDLLALRPRGDRAPDQHGRARVRAGRDRDLRARAGADHAGRLRRAGPARVREHPDRRDPADPDAPRLRGDRGRASSQRSDRRRPGAAAPA